MVTLFRTLSIVLGLSLSISAHAGTWLEDQIAKVLQEGPKASYSDFQELFQGLLHATEGTSRYGVARPSDVNEPYYWAKIVTGRVLGPLIDGAILQLQSDDIAERTIAFQKIYLVMSQLTYDMRNRSLGGERLLWSEEAYNLTGRLYNKINLAMQQAPLVEEDVLKLASVIKSDYTAVYLNGRGRMLSFSEMPRYDGIDEAFPSAIRKFTLSDNANVRNAVLKIRKVAFGTTMHTSADYDALDQLQNQILGLILQKKYKEALMLGINEPEDREIGRRERYSTILDYAYRDTLALLDIEDPLFHDAILEMLTSGDKKVQTRIHRLLSMEGRIIPENFEYWTSAAQSHPELRYEISFQMIRGYESTTSTRVIDPDAYNRKIYELFQSVDFDETLRISKETTGAHVLHAQKDIEKYVTQHQEVYLAEVLAEKIANQTANGTFLAKCKLTYQKFLRLWNRHK